MIAEIFASAISVGAISARSEFTILEIQVLRMLVEVVCRRSRLAVLSATMISLVLVMPERGDASPQAKAETAPPSAKGAVVQFEEQILPILEANCFKCHSGSSAQAGLDVRTRSGLLKGGTSGPAIVVGVAEKSLLYQRVRSGQMPLGGSPLAAPDVEHIRLWIEQGAAARNLEPPPASIVGANPADRAHWAFQPPQRPVLPKVKNASQVHTPIDAFVLSELERNNLTFSPDADRGTLLRRVYFDVIGLPPTPKEVDDFLSDRSPKAYERVVDKLLSSEHYGERWARHWLDAAGYADSEGVLAEDRLRANAWRYRDYVIRSFNSDKPYDRFVVEQLAGDELVNWRDAQEFTPEVIESLEATGFLRMAVDATRIDFTPVLYADYQWRTLFHTQQIVASSLMGLTLQCATCHDHKYEPISQKDYYRMQALFMGGLRPQGRVLPTSQRVIIQATEAERRLSQELNAQVDASVQNLNNQQKKLLEEYQAKHPKGKEATEEELKQAFPDLGPKLEELTQARQAEEANRMALPSIRAFYDQDAHPPPTRTLRRGDYRQPGEEVEPGVLTVLDDPNQPFRLPPPVTGAQTTGRRLAFARWLTRPDHPLTARVMVNRIWAHHFGVGIVPVLDNFGKSGPPPTNQQLLDWLATELVHQGWRMKAIHRLILTSTVYRQASQARVEALKVDPEDKLLWRMRPRRLEAEIVRDAILAAAGTLDLKMYGPPVPTETKASGEIVPVSDTRGGRRSVYQLVRRSQLQSFLNVFDAPLMELNCTRRSTSTTASQALALMNGEFISAQAELFARRVLKEFPPSDGSRLADAKTITDAFRLAVARRPRPEELNRLLDFVNQQAGRYGNEKPDVLPVQVYRDLCQALLSMNEFVYLD